jgi:hypothetical protein
LWLARTCCSNRESSQWPFQRTPSERASDSWGLGQSYLSLSLYRAPAKYQQGQGAFRQSVRGGCFHGLWSQEDLKSNLHLVTLERSFELARPQFPQVERCCEDQVRQCTLEHRAQPHVVTLLGPVWRVQEKAPTLYTSL